MKQEDEVSNKHFEFHQYRKFHNQKLNKTELFYEYQIRARERGNMFSTNKTVQAVEKILNNKNKCDLVVANDLSTIRNGEHIAYIIDRNNKIEECHGKDDIELCRQHLACGKCSASYRVLSS